MRNSSLSVITILAMACATVILYIVINDILFIVFPLKRPSIAMGLSTRFAAYLFAIVTFLSMFAWVFKSLKVVVPLVIGLLAIFAYYWIRIIPYYPYRATCLLLEGALIYSAMHSYLYYKRLFR
ncbi:MAG: hypothetical protein QM762_00275 [Chryseolinea sp.]